MFETFCVQSEHEEVVIAGDSCGGEMCIRPLTFVDCLLLTGAGVDNLDLIIVGLELCDVEHLVSFLVCL